MVELNPNGLPLNNLQDALLSTKVGCPDEGKATGDGQLS